VVIKLDVTNIIAQGRPRMLTCALLAVANLVKSCLLINVLEKSR